MGFNSAFKGLNVPREEDEQMDYKDMDTKI
jgi:hypothetical protein